ncbi:TPA: hypothetical protein ACPVW6_004666 [Vibrio parahaemolyticus]|uniref:hypothetical protein n=1 Tax=Vibrio parahaemolyticus TaxID=670 RepID=UPI00226A060F|nr:hypothetical protein [Vibrio parahaemolyticus]EKC5524275.1 hypothetical protein [Vibrio parahaemolyticus]MCX8880339.1 hypothetical protein [Vibrio parahaemolyticus]HCE5300305.1 hypothetical protein [Vibrio parahaemolyticus]
MKKCFVIMPISDSPAEGYVEGHFQTVYDHLIKPAVEKAGFKPIRADEHNETHSIALKIIKDIVDSDMVVCDISNKNPNVLYELGIRHALKKPVSIIKDNKTKDIFDIQGQGIRRIEYDVSLNIGKISPLINELATNIENTYENRGKVGSSLFDMIENNASSPSKSNALVRNDNQVKFTNLESIGIVEHWNEEKRTGVIRSDGESFYFHETCCVGRIIPTEGSEVYFYALALRGNKPTAVCVLTVGKDFHGKVYAKKFTNEYGFALVEDDKGNRACIYVPTAHDRKIKKDSKIMFTVKKGGKGAIAQDAITT